MTKLPVLTLSVSPLFFFSKHLIDGKISYISSFFFGVFWPEGEKLQWFQSQLDPEKTSYTRKDACEIIERSDVHLLMWIYFMSNKACFVCADTYTGLILNLNKLS